MKRVWKLVTLILLIVSLVATTIVIYGYKHFWFNQYDRIIKNDNKTISLAIHYKGKKTSNVVTFPSYYRGYKVNDVFVSSEEIIKIVMPNDIDFFDIEVCPELEEVVMPINFDCDEVSIAPSHKEKVTLIVKENSKAKQYAIDNGYKYRIEE